MAEKTPKSFGRKTISATLKPRELMTPTPELKGAWKAHVITLFPEAFPGVLGLSLTGRALKDGLWNLETTHLRDFGAGRHRNIDDTPAGGGAGMVMRADIMAKAIDQVQSKMPADVPVLMMSPRGRPFTQSMARSLSEGDGAILICGRFEGLDQRVIDHYNITEVCFGDFVMTGGEIAAQALIDSTVRLIPRVLGNQASVEEESFSNGLLEHPQYTKPAVWNDRDIPEVLLSGHHAKISDWQRDQAERLTKERRPDLWRAYCAQHGKNPEEDTEL